MKKLGIAEDMDKLKTFKYCLMSRSQDTIQQKADANVNTTIASGEGNLNSTTIQRTLEQQGTSLDTLYQNNNTINNQSIAHESEQTTLERTDVMK